jgi:Saccharopine dehydrogenase NADP binding domain
MTFAGMPISKIRADKISVAPMAGDRSTASGLSGNPANKGRAINPKQKWPGPGALSRSTTPRWHSTIALDESFVSGFGVPGNCVVPLPLPTIRPESSSTRPSGGRSGSRGNVSTGVIALLGATGFTGRLVAAELARGSRPYRLGARSLERLARISRSERGKPFTVDVNDRARMDEFLEGATGLINTVGPFMELGLSVVEAAFAMASPTSTRRGSRISWRNCIDASANPRLRSCRVAASTIFRAT